MNSVITKYDFSMLLNKGCHADNFSVKRSLVFALILIDLGNQNKQKFLKYCKFYIKLPSYNNRKTIPS